MSLCHRFCFHVNGRFSSAHRFSCFQVKFIGVVHQPVKDCVGQCLVLHGVMPVNGWRVYSASINASSSNSYSSGLATK